MTTTNTPRTLPLIHHTTTQLLRATFIRCLFLFCSFLEIASTVQGYICEGECIFVPLFSISLFFYAWVSFSAAQHLTRYTRYSHDHRNCNCSHEHAPQRLNVVGGLDGSRPHDWQSTVKMHGVNCPPYLHFLFIFVYVSLPLLYSSLGNSTHHSLSSCPWANKKKISHLLFLESVPWASASQFPFSAALGSCSRLTSSPNIHSANCGRPRTFFFSSIDSSERR